MEEPYNDETVTRAYRFAMVPEWVLLHPDLDGTAVRVFGVLDRFAGRSREAWPGLSKLAGMIGASVDTVRRAVRKLEEVGAVRVVEQYDTEGRQTSNRYVLAGDAPMHTPPRVAATHGGSSRARGEGGTVATQTRARGNESQRNETPAATQPGALVHVGEIIDLPSAKSTRPRNLMWDVVCEVLNIDADNVLPANRSRIGRLVSNFNAVGATPDDVRLRAEVYRRMWPKLSLTPEALLKHWDQLTPNADTARVARGGETVAERMARAARAMEGRR